MKKEDKKEYLKLVYISLITIIFFFIVALEKSFFFWKMYILYIIILLIVLVAKKIKENSKKEIKKEEESVFFDRVEVDSEIKEGDLVEVYEDGKKIQGVVSAVASDVASVQMKDEIKMVERIKIKKINTKGLELKKLFFLGSSLLEKLQELKQTKKLKVREEFYSNLSECVDFFKNGDFKNDYDEIVAHFSEYENVEQYFSELRNIVTKGGISLRGLKYSSFEIDMATAMLFDEGGQKVLINSVDALRLVRKYLNID